MTDWLQNNENTPTKVKAKIQEDAKALAKLAEPKLISSHKDYTLSESIVGDTLYTKKERRKYGRKKTRYTS